VATYTAPYVELKNCTPTWGCVMELTILLVAVFMGAPWYVILTMGVGYLLLTVLANNQRDEEI
jgi:hypothetical protein